MLAHRPKHYGFYGTFKPEYLYPLPWSLFGSVWVCVQGNRKHAYEFLNCISPRQFILRFVWGALQASANSEVVNCMTEHIKIFKPAFISTPFTSEYNGFKNFLCYKTSIKHIKILMMTFPTLQYILWTVVIWFHGRLNIVLYA